MRLLQGLGAALNLGRIIHSPYHPSLIDPKLYSLAMARSFADSAAEPIDPTTSTAAAAATAAVAAEQQSGSRTESIDAVRGLSKVPASSTTSSEDGSTAHNKPAAMAGADSTDGKNGGSWEDMLKVLGSLILFKNRADANGWRDAFENMPIYLQRIGLSEQLPGLSIIHVAGTKGKGSTCAMVESMLRSCGYSTGLFTSPHLVDVRERVRINGQMTDKSRFLRMFWQCYNQLSQQATPEVGVPGYFRFLTLLGLKIFTEAQVDVVVLEVGIGGRLDATNVVAAPVVTGITSLGFDHMEMLGHTLPEIAREKAGILKRTIPGFTVEQPADAMQALQATADAVGAPLVVPRPLDEFTTVDGNPVEVGLGGEHQRINASLAIALAASWEERSAAGQANAGSAARIAAVKAGKVPAEYAAGLANVVWPGRSHIIEDTQLGGRSHGSSSSSSSSAISASTATGGDSKAQAGGGSSSSSGKDATSNTSMGSDHVEQAEGGGGSRLTFYLDGAHTPESMATCAAWFGGAAVDKPVGDQHGHVHNTKHVLLFNCMKERDPATLLPELSAQLATHGSRPDAAIFVAPQSIYGVLAVPSATAASSPAPAATAVDLSWQKLLATVWAKAEGSSDGAVGITEWPPAVAGHESKTQDAPTNGPLITIAPSLVEALAWMRQWTRAQPNSHVHVLVAGSLYLVGDVLRMLDKPPT